MANEVEAFLAQIWGKQSGFVFLPRKTSRWIELDGIPWPTDEPLPIDFDADSYFCPQVFSVPFRKQDNALPSPWLYADLDAVRPHHIALRPTIAIQSSPGRYQAFWKMARPSLLPRLSNLNQRLTYAVGADRGGWGLAKVLRLPGTFNYKYPSRTKVRILWNDGPVYKLREIEDFVRGVEAHEVDIDIPGLVLPAESRESILEGVKLDARTRSILDGTAELGSEGRSGLLWELECRLLEAGLSPEETFVVVRESIFNKHAGRGRGDDQLWREVTKAHLHIGPRSTSGVREHYTSGTGLVRMRPRIVSYADILSSGARAPEWLIDQWWTLGSHGVVAGLPKSYKSLAALDFSVSVASETPFLGQYEVNPKGVGPVLVIQQENSLALVRDRLLKIAASRGLMEGMSSVAGDGSIMVRFPPAIPLFFYNDFGFDMTREEDRESIEEVIRYEGIRLLVFDPLYLMIGAVNENQSWEIRPVLTWLLRLRNIYGTAIIVVHHWSKSKMELTGRGKGGTKLMGNTLLYGWLEAALYMEAKYTADSIEVVIEREFRERLAQPPMKFNLDMGEPGDSLYEWDAAGYAGHVNTILIVLADKPNGLTTDELREASGMGAKTFRREAKELVGNHMIRMERDGKANRYFLAT